MGIFAIMKMPSFLPMQYFANNALPDGASIGYRYLNKVINQVDFAHSLGKGAHVNVVLDYHYHPMKFDRPSTDDFRITAKSIDGRLFGHGSITYDRAGDLEHDAPLREEKRQEALRQADTIAAGYRNLGLKVNVLDYSLRERYPTLADLVKD